MEHRHRHQSSSRMVSAAAGEPGCRAAGWRLWSLRFSVVNLPGFRCWGERGPDKSDAASLLPEARVLLGALTTCRGDGRRLETVGARVLNCCAWHTRQAHAREVPCTWKVHRTGRDDNSFVQTVLLWCLTAVFFVVEFVAGAPIV